MKKLFIVFLLCSSNIHSWILERLEKQEITWKSPKGTPLSLDAGISHLLQNINLFGHKTSRTVFSEA